MIRLAVLLMLLLASCTTPRYLNIHRKAVLVDTHNDLLSSVTLEGMRIEDDLRGKTHSDLRRFRAGGVDVQVFSIFCDEHYGRGTAYAYANREIDSLQAIAARHPGQLRLVGDPETLRESLGKGVLIGMMGVEGGHMIEEDLSRVDSFYNRGVRYMTLTWNNSTPWASSNKDEKDMPDSAKGLSAFGRQVVSRMNALGMIVDVSHVGEQTFYDALATTTKPVIASHSSVYSICPVSRNLKDDQLRAIAKNGGVVHINFYSGFLDSSFERKRNAFEASHAAERDSMRALQMPDYLVGATLAKRYPAEANAIRPPLSLLIDHIDYVARLIGVEHVGIGSDFDGIDSSPQGMDGVQDFPSITRELLKRGYSQEDVRKILGGNFLRVFSENSKK